MKDTARKKDRSQGTPHIGQLALAAIFEARATLYETVVYAGVGVLAAMLEEDRTRLCGHRYEHDRSRQATRGGHTEGELPFGGRRVRVRRPRVRGREVPLPTWEHFADADPLTPRAVEQMVLGVSTRNYDRSLEPTPAGLTSRGASKSAVSRRFVGATTQTLSEMMGRDLSESRGRSELALFRGRSSVLPDARPASHSLGKEIMDDQDGAPLTGLFTGYHSDESPPARRRLRTSARPTLSSTRSPRCP